MSGKFTFILIVQSVSLFAIQCSNSIKSAPSPTPQDVPQEESVLKNDYLKIENPGSAASEATTITPATPNPSDFSQQVIVTEVTAPEQKPERLRILDFNAETNNGEWGPSKCNKKYNEMINFSKNKIQNLAKLIIDNKIDIAFFQEMQNRCDFNETEELAKLLQESGYPMHVAFKEYIRGQTQWFHVATFSLYPLGNVVHSPLSDTIDSNVRWFTMATIKLPGNLDIVTYNLHTRNTTACEHVQYFLKHVANDSAPFLLLAGDFNHVMKNDACGESLSRYSLNTANGIITPGSDSIPDPIDYVLIGQNDLWNFESSHYKRNSVDYHPTLYATVKLN